ncbi:serine hydrolase [Tunturiibacter gelidiferens]|uniref:serine hydrolase n=1 Tax=Tunturiibacter gelidiferens TaxID=3069689 RepID=UPI003D9BD25C
MFNPPNLIGKVSERTALEAMIMHSDNTGTDMCLKHVGPEKVRQFVASAGLKSCMIPESTRALFGYLLGRRTTGLLAGRIWGRQQIRRWRICR